MHVAYKVWDQADESLDSVEARIHDGVPPDKLHKRADRYVHSLYAQFPHAVPRRTDVVLEIGPGVGYIMEAMMRRFVPAQIIGLEVAPAMIAHARARMARDHVDMTRFKFQAYDGTTLPFPDRSIDHVYSVACFQHIPKVHAYHLFAEILRVLRDGYTALHLLSFSALPKREEPFIKEVNRQLAGEEGQHHFYYAKDEMIHVLGALGARNVAVADQDGALWTVFRH